MREMRISIIEVDEDSGRSDPIKLLLVNVFERAYNDLQHGDKHIRRTAESWFRKWENYMPYGRGISYKDVRDNIDLGAERLKKLTVMLGGIE